MMEEQLSTGEEEGQGVDDNKELELVDEVAVGKTPEANPPPTPTLRQQSILRFTVACSPGNMEPQNIGTSNTARGGTRNRVKGGGRRGQSWKAALFESAAAEIPDNEITANKVTISPAISSVSPSSVKENVEPMSAVASRPKKTAVRRKYKPNPNVVITYTTKPKRRNRNASGQSNATTASSSSKKDMPASAVSSCTGDVKKVKTKKTKAAVSNTKGKKVADDDNDVDEFSVERIDNKEKINGKYFYRIKWKGWPEEANTWEPVEHLDGCPALLKEFERKWEEKHKREKKTKTRTILLSDDDDYDEDTLIQKAQPRGKTYTVLKEWPADKAPPISVEGVIAVDGILTYVVKKNSRLGSKIPFGRSNAVLVHAEGFKRCYPELVINFYQSRLMWSSNNKDSAEKAEIAAQMELLHKNRQSRLGMKISEDIDKVIAKDNVNVETGELKGQTELTETDINTEGTETDFSTVETQVVSVDVDDEKAEVDTDDNLMENDNISETDQMMDKFGLPEQINEDDRVTIVGDENEDDSNVLSIGVGMDEIQE